MTRVSRPFAQLDTEISVDGPITTEAAQCTVSTEEQRWASRLRAGCTVTFWFLLIPRLVTNLIALALPFVGVGAVYLKWARAIHTAGALPLLIGIAMLTASPPSGSGMWVRRSGWVFRIVAVVEVGCRLLRSAADFASVPAISTYAGGIAASNDIAFVIVAATYLAAVNHRLGVTHMHREIWMACSVFVGVTVVDLGIDASAPEWYSSFPVVLLGMFYASAMALWGLSILWRCRRLVGRLTDDLCVQCGYDLRGQPIPRCPECGTPFRTADKSNETP